MPETVNFVFPAWFSDRSLPRSVLAARAEGAVVVTGTEFRIGDVTQPVTAPTDDAVDEAELLPQVSWIPPDAAPREPGADEVTARRVLLSGGYGIGLDRDGEGIPPVDPAQPGGGRVLNLGVRAAGPRHHPHPPARETP